MTVPITASMLYDLVHCPHRVTMDLFEDSAKRDPTNPFLELLWEKGYAYEREVMVGLAQPFLDLSKYAGDEKERRTREAMVAGEPLIYSGRLHADDLLGDPDLLRKEGAGYVPGDIKSGAGEEGKEDLAKPKRHYGVQLALYVDLLERVDLSAGRRAFVWDINGEEVAYELEAPLGVKTPQTLWDEYQRYLQAARTILSNRDATLPAYSSVCKLCHWHTACLTAMQAANDLTLIPGLGRPKRDVMTNEVSSIAHLAATDPEAFITGKKTVFAGIGPDSLLTFHARATLLTTQDARPYLREPITLPHSDKELFFDIEVDVMRDVVYLHGFVERHSEDDTTERYIAFFADIPSAEAEEHTFAQAWSYLSENQDAVIYYYAPYERVQWRKLQAKYPHVCTEEDIEALFDQARATDLYTDIVRSKTEWPTRDHSIKTLAHYLGFDWRDTHPSGAASVQWYDRWTKTNAAADKQRILDYNEDDCRAMRVLLNGLRELELVE